MGTCPHAGTLGIKHLVSCVHLVGAVRLPVSCASQLSGRVLAALWMNSVQALAAWRFLCSRGMFSQVPENSSQKALVFPPSNRRLSFVHKAQVCERERRPWCLVPVILLTKVEIFRDSPALTPKRVQTRDQSNTEKKGDQH